MRKEVNKQMVDEADDNDGAGQGKKYAKSDFDSRGIEPAVKLQGATKPISLGDEQDEQDRESDDEPNGNEAGAR